MLYWDFVLVRYHSFVRDCDEGQKALLPFVKVHIHTVSNASMTALKKAVFRTSMQGRHIDIHFGGLAHEPCVSRVESNPSPPAATYPSLAPHASVAAQKEKRRTVPVSENRSR